MSSLSVGMSFRKNLEAGRGQQGRRGGKRRARLLTYLAGAAAHGSAERRQGLLRVGLVGAGTQAVEVGAGLAPGEVVDDGQALVPEQCGAVGEGQDARVDERLEGSRPLFALAEPCL